jgi:hypothetical protein
MVVKPAFLLTWTTSMQTHLPRIESAHVIAARGKLGGARCCVSTLATALSQFWNP